MIISARSQAAGVPVAAVADEASPAVTGRPWAKRAAAASAPVAAIFVPVSTTCARGPVRKPATFRIAAATRADAAAARSQPATPVAFARYSAKTSAIAAMEAG